MWRGSSHLDLPATEIVPLQKGDVVELSVGGGAGWGNPANRASEFVEADLADGVISPEFAARHYRRLS